MFPEVGESHVECCLLGHEAHAAEAGNVAEPGDERLPLAGLERRPSDHRRKLLQIGQEVVDQHLHLVALEASVGDDVGSGEDRLTSLLPLVRQPDRLGVVPAAAAHSAVSEGELEGAEVAEDTAVQDEVGRGVVASGHRLVEVLDQLACGPVVGPPDVGELVGGQEGVVGPGPLLSAFFFEPNLLTSAHIVV